jgi:poly(A) polymerase
MLNKILGRLGLVRKEKDQGKGHKPIIVPRSEHRISRANISKHALKVLYRLRDAGFKAFLVGGGVRDVLLDRHPKDFDVATDALPEEVQKLFRNCRLIGRRFRLAHVHFGYQIVEVATFRANSSDDQTRSPHLVHSEAGMILRDNIYGTLEDDVFRRDFTVNALYYNIDDFSVIDYVGGLKDLKAKCLRMIGDAAQRCREDPVRMLRAIRFAGKLDFHIHPDSETPIYELAYLVKQVPNARLLDEYTKLFLTGAGEANFRLLRKYGIFAVLFPETERALSGENSQITNAFINGALLDTDKRVLEDKPVALPFLLAAFLWHPVLDKAKVLVKGGATELAAFYEAMDLTLEQQQSTVAISRRLIQAIREIWTLQFRLTRRTGKRAAQLFIHPRFRAAYDFLLLRATSGEKAVQELADWWKQFVHSDETIRLSMVSMVKSKRHV